jgi:hypothetical protein
MTSFSRRPPDGRLTPKILWSVALVLLLSGCGGGNMTTVAPDAGVKVADPPAVTAPSPQGITGRLIVGYQGWFGCPGDYEGNARWYRWFRRDASPSQLMVDLVPSQHDLSSRDVCDTGLLNADGTPLRVYSAQNPHVVDAHFRWMQQHGIDGAALQRFVLELDDPVEKERRDHVIANVRAAAEASGRVFFITYDISGEGPNSVEAVAKVRDDWRHLVDDLGVTQSSAYLKDHGKPVLEIWGFGFNDRAGEPGEVAALIRDLKNGGDGMQAAYLMGGVPSRWRTLSGSSKADPAWAAIYRSYDALSPWSVGRFGDDAGADAYLNDVVLADLQETSRLGIAYMPVTFPGFSWRNQMINKSLPDIAIFNQIPRRCGDFLWHQYANLLGAGVQSVYGAMFDEFDEGTALAPAQTSILGVPVTTPVVVLDQEGCSLPDDWYLRVTGKAADYLRSGTAPPPLLSQAM